MDRQSLETTKDDVASRFRTPQEVLDAKGCNREQKIELLRQWEHDLRLLMVASDENMTAQAPRQKPGGSAETFQAVRKALDSLGAAEAEDAAASKLGGGSSS